MMCDLHGLKNNKQREQMLSISDILSHHLINHDILYLGISASGVDYFDIFSPTLDMELYVKFMNDEPFLQHTSRGTVNYIKDIGIYIAHYINGGHCEFCSM